MQGSIREPPSMPPFLKPRPAPHIMPASPSGTANVTFQTWQRAAPGIGRHMSADLTDMHVVCKAGLPRLGEGQPVCGQPDHDAGRHRFGPRVPQVLQTLLRQRSNPGLPPAHAALPSCTSHTCALCDHACHDMHDDDTRAVPIYLPLPPAHVETSS